LLKLFEGEVAGQEADIFGGEGEGSFDKTLSFYADPVAAFPVFGAEVNGGGFEYFPYGGEGFGYFGDAVNIKRGVVWLIARARCFCLWERGEGFERVLRCRVLCCCLCFVCGFLCNWFPRCCFFRNCLFLQLSF
jgi:hypothetical protein